MPPSGYGSWTSPISAELIAGDVVGLGAITLDGEDIYWSELRPAEGGRATVIRRRQTRSEIMVPPPYNVRTRVHEYGGGAYAVADGVIYFVNDADQRVYRLPPTASPTPLTSTGDRRYADLVVDRARDRLVAICEDHGVGAEPAHSIVAIDATAAAVRTLVYGRDFYASPRISPDGRRLAFLAWDHPNMPWDGSQLYVAELGADGSVAAAHCIAGGIDESIFQPEFAPDGTLYFISDRTGWWNLYRHRDGQSDPVLTLAAEFGMPQWVFGLSTYAFISSQQILCAFNERGVWRLGVLDVPTRAWRTFETPYTDIAYVRANEQRAVFLAAGPTSLPAIVELDLASERFSTLQPSANFQLDAGYFSTPEAITYPTAGAAVAHAFFYRPCNPDVVAPAHERPPLLVMSHGGPTSATTSALNFKVQYWTSRGFAVLDVNYRGSSGYGRAYRRALDGTWGIADVADCVHGVQFLIERGDVDAKRLAIRGGSAGGYTTLCALAFHEIFGAGAVYYGVSDLEALVRDTHKFESRYLDRLIGRYPEQRECYLQRSPIHYAERIRCPVIFFQGLEDRVVPPDQTERVVQALRARGGVVAYLAFPGEQHGFRRGEHIRRALETELYFYGRTFGFITDATEIGIPTDPN